uniref:Uncharacterized protein n=1 Tax=Solanum lycopersicum TaxID=4081 RepID=A0A3Q7JN14_SOLLC
MRFIYWFSLLVKSGDTLICVSNTFISCCVSSSYLIRMLILTSFAFVVQTLSEFMVDLFPQRCRIKLNRC